MAMREEMERQGNWLFRFRGVLPIIILAMAFGQYAYTELYNGDTILQSSPYEYIYSMVCLLISLFGLAIRVYTVGHTPDKTSGRNVKEQVAEELNTTGIYSVVRNPLYLGNFFMWFGIALLTQNGWFVVAFLLFYWVYYERIIYAEEQFLSRKFGAAYDSWAASTPCFVPRLHSGIHPTYKFSWRKVILKEKNGFVAVLIIFSALDLLGSLLTGYPPVYLWLTYAAIASIVGYGILKYIKHKKRWAHRRQLKHAQKVDSAK